MAPLTPTTNASAEPSRPNTAVEEYYETTKFMFPPGRNTMGPPTPELGPSSDTLPTHQTSSPIRPHTIIPARPISLNSLSSPPPYYPPESESSSQSQPTKLPSLRPSWWRRRKKKHLVMMGIGALAILATIGGTVGGLMLKKTSNAYIDLSAPLSENHTIKMAATTYTDSEGNSCRAVVWQKPNMKLSMASRCRQSSSVSGNWTVSAIGLTNPPDVLGTGLAMTVRTKNVGLPTATSEFHIFYADGNNRLWSAVANVLGSRTWYNYNLSRYVNDWSAQLAACTVSSNGNAENQTLFLAYGSGNQSDFGLTRFDPEDRTIMTDPQTIPNAFPVDISSEMNNHTAVALVGDTNSTSTYASFFAETLDEQHLSYTAMKESATILGQPFIVSNNISISSTILNRTPKPPLSQLAVTSYSDAQSRNVQKVMHLGSKGNLRSLMIMIDGEVVDTKVIDLNELVARLDESVYRFESGGERVFSGIAAAGKYLYINWYGTAFELDTAEGLSIVGRVSDLEFT